MKVRLLGMCFCIRKTNLLYSLPSLSKCNLPFSTVIIQSFAVVFNICPSPIVILLAPFDNPF